MRVAFKSRTPVSFRAIVEFSDDNRIAVCPVAIHATSENCLLTTHTYVRNSMIDLKRTMSIDRRTPRVSRTSEIFTDDEDYNVDFLKSVRTAINRQVLIKLIVTNKAFTIFMRKIHTCFFFRNYRK